MGNPRAIISLTVISYFPTAHFINFTTKHITNTETTNIPIILKNSIGLSKIDCKITFIFSIFFTSFIFSEHNYQETNDYGYSQNYCPKTPIFYQITKIFKKCLDSFNNVFYKLFDFFPKTEFRLL